MSIKLHNVKDQKLRRRLEQALAPQQILKHAIGETVERLPSLIIEPTTGRRLRQQTKPLLNKLGDLYTSLQWKNQVFPMKGGCNEV